MVTVTCFPAKRICRRAFDLYFRKVPDNGGYAIAAGLSGKMIVLIFWNNSILTKEDIHYLRSKNQFSEEFLQYLADFEFERHVYAVEEGTPCISERTSRYGQRSGDTGSTA